MLRFVQMLLAGSSIVIATAALAAPTGTSPAATFVPPVLVPLIATATPGEAGMRAFIDPETKLLRAPTAIEAAAGLPELDNWQDKVVETRSWDGSPMIDVQGHMQDYMILQVGADGRLLMRCVEDPKTALQGGVAPAARPEEE